MHYQLSSEGEATVVTFTGDICEGVEHALDEVLAKLRTPKVVIDCKRISMMNSTGTGQWCRFQAALDARGGTVEYRCIPSIMIHFAGVLTNFFGKATLRCFYVSYFCEPCDKTHPVLIDAARFRAAAALPAGDCPVCRTSMHPEVDVDGYVDVLLDCLSHVA